jgi:hypothetical protein
MYTVSTLTRAKKKMNDRVTFESFPLDAYKKYAETQEKFANQPYDVISDSSLIPFQTEIAVASPTFSQFDELFGVLKKSTWGLFIPPPGFFIKKKRFFGIRIIDDIDPDECAERFYEELEKLFSEKKKILNENERTQPEKAIVALLEMIDQLNKLLSEVRARIHQFAKG